MGDVDLEGFALRELLEFVRKSSPAWPEGAVVDEAPVEVDGKVLVQLLMHKDRVEALGRVLSRTQTRDNQEEEAVDALLRALRRWADSQGVRMPPKATLRLVKAAAKPGEGPMMTAAPEATVVGELAMMVRQLVSALKRYEPDHPVASQATRLLVDRGLLRGNGLRAEYVQLDRESLARSADLVATRLASADMMQIDSQDGITMGRDGKLLGPGGVPLIALDAGPGRGLIGPRWQFEPSLQAALGPIADALDTKDGWALLSFLETPQGALEGSTPRQAIEQGHLDRVLQSARAEGY